MYVTPGFKAHREITIIYFISPFSLALNYMLPKNALAKPRSYMLNNSSSLGKGTSIDGRGRHKRLTQVLAVGKNPFKTSTKTKVGCRTKPRTGSSSAPVVNFRI